MHDPIPTEGIWVPIKIKPDPAAAQRYRNHDAYKGRFWAGKHTRPKGTVITGTRIYLKAGKGVSANKVRAALGKLVKKVRRAADGRIEIIHTDNRHPFEIFRIIEENGWEKS
jgi:hypothetical protein